MPCHSSTTCKSKLITTVPQTYTPLLTCSYLLTGPLFFWSDSRLANILDKVFSLLQPIPTTPLPLPLITQIHTSTWYQTTIVLSFPKSPAYPFLSVSALLSKSGTSLPHTSTSFLTRLPLPARSIWNTSHPPSRRPTLMLCRDTSKNTANGKTEAQLSLWVWPCLRDKMTKQNQRSNQISRRGHTVRSRHVAGAEKQARITSFLPQFCPKSSIKTVSHWTPWGTNQ